jgi:hypothetical protein
MSARRAPKLRGTFGPEDITVIPPNGFPPNSFTLAARLHFMLSDDVAFPKKNSRVLAGATEIRTQLGQELGRVEPGKLSNDDALSLNL